MKKFILIIPILILTLTSLTWGVPLTGSRSWGNGIKATGGSDGWETENFIIKWDIQNVGGSFPWEYNYTIYSPNKEISHWIFEVSLDATKDDFNFGSIYYEGPKLWEPSSGNPGMPSNIYGIKFDNLKGHINTFTFYSTRAPVWGDFYAKDGWDKEDNKRGKPNDGVWVIAFNIGFGGDPTSPPYTNWIAVPDTKTIVPEPGLLILLGLGLTAVGVATRFVRKV